TRWCTRSPITSASATPAARSWAWATRSSSGSGHLATVGHRLPPCRDQPAERVDLRPELIRGIAVRGGVRAQLLLDHVVADGNRSKDHDRRNVDARLLIDSQKARDGVFTLLVARGECLQPRRDAPFEVFGEKASRPGRVDARRVSGDGFGD